MIYASVMLEKFPNNGQEYLKYMQTVRMAASRGGLMGDGFSMMNIDSVMCVLFLNCIFIYRFSTVIFSWPLAINNKTC